MGNYWLFSERSLEIRNNKKKHILDNLFNNSSITKENNPNAIIVNINSLVDTLLAKKDVTSRNRKNSKYIGHFFIDSVFGMSDLISVKKLFAIVIFFVLIFAVIASATSFVDSDNLSDTFTSNTIEDPSSNNSSSQINQIFNYSSGNVTFVNNMSSEPSTNFTIPSSNITDFNESQNETIVSSGLNLSIWADKDAYVVNESVFISGFVMYNNSLINTTVNLSIIGSCYNSSIILDVINGSFGHEFIPIFNCSLVINAVVSYYNETVREEIGFEVFNIPFENVSLNAIDLHVWDDTDNQVKYIGDQVTFYANYSCDNVSILNASCYISFELGNWTKLESMDFIDGLFVYSRSFENAGPFSYQIFCSVFGLENKTAFDMFFISEIKNESTKISIDDSKDKEFVYVLPGTNFYIERTLNGPNNLSAIFAPLFSEGLSIERIEIIKHDNSRKKIIDIIKDNSPNKFIAGKGKNSVEKKIDNLRKKLPANVKKLNLVSYSKEFTLNSPITVRVWFKTPSWEEIRSGISPSSGKISYLTFSDDSYDFESSTWWNSNWGKRKLIIINSSQVESDLTNFPILVNITDTDLANYAQDDGDDIAFILYSDNTTQLNHEIELFNSTTGNLVTWVNITSLSSSSDTKIWMFYNNSGSSNQQNPTDVWDSNYVGVWHLNETGTGTRYDATSNNNDGTPTNYDNDEATTGIIDGADQLDGSSDYISMGNILTFVNTNDLMLEAWFSAGSFATLNPILERARLSDGARTDYGMTITDASTVSYHYDSAATADVYTSWTVSAMNTGEWHYLAINAYTDTTVTAYFDGQIQSNQAGEHGDFASDGFYLGTGDNGGTQQYFNGVLDEVRISDKTRSTAWINTCYNTMRNTTTFLSISIEENITDTSVDTISPYNVSYSPFTITATGADGLDNITLWYRFSSDNSSWDDWTQNVSDTISPWSWSFSFTNGTGYYEFHSIGRLSGFSDESAPINADAICYFNSSINTPPTIELINPSPNGTIGISTLQICQIWANDSDSSTLDVYWFENSTGSYILRNTNSSISANTTVSYTFSEFSNYSTSYWWKVAVNDSEDNTSAIYYFTTNSIDTSVDTVSPYIVTSSPLDIYATGPSDLDNVTLYYRWSKDNSTWGTRSLSIFEDFESGSQNTSLWNTYQTPASDARIQWNYGTAHGGSYSCAMDDFDTATGDAALNVIYTNYDFTGASNINIDFWEREWGDEPEDAPDSWAGWGNYDVVAFTNDGSTWYEVVSEASLNVGAFTNFQYNISADPDFSSPPTSSFAIAFQQYDNYQLINDGRAWDDIFINCTVSDEVNGTDWIEWSDGSNPDEGSPWGWGFDFPNGTGYYEFYSIGNKSGSPEEITPGSADAICLFNRLPTITNEGPSNGSINIEIYPQLNITVNDLDADTMTITWYSNSSGSWQVFGNNATVMNGTFHQTNLNFSQYSNTYWWYVTVNDGVHINTSNTFYFTTLLNGPPIVFTNISTGVEETNATLRGYLDINGSLDTTCGFRYGTNSGIYSENFIKGIYPSNSEFSNNNGSLAQGQLYFYQAWASNSVGFANGTEMTFLTKPEPPSGLVVQMNSSSIIYLTWTKGLGSNTTYIERNATGVSIWGISEGTMIYNGSGVNYEDTGLNEGVTYYYQAWSFTNWTYDSNTFYQWSDNNASGNSTTNNKPTQSGESPTNGSLGISRETYLYVICSDIDGDTLNATWWSNSSGSWVQFASNETSFASGTNISQNNSNFSDYGKTYWWSVNVSDGEGDWINETYHFTTQLIGTSVDTISPYILTSSPKTITATNNTAVDNITLYYRWSKDNSTWGTRSLSIFEDFESGSQNTSLWNTYQTPASDARIQWNYGTAHGGSNSCAMDDFDTATGDAALNVIYTNYDFTGASNINIDFWEREWGDEPEDAPDSWSGWGNYDVVAFTNDGSTWYEVVSEASLNVGAFTNFQYNISADPDFSSPPTSSFAIAFQQYDNYQLINDGRAWDDIFINCTVHDEVNGTDWIEWSDGSNPDENSPWSWSFDFPNGTGYYEFYSIGKESGSIDEIAPNSADAICNYIPPTRPVVITNISSGVEETNATLSGYLSSNGGLDTTCGFRYGINSGIYSENFSVGIISNTTEFSNNNGSLTQGQIYYYQVWAKNSVGFANGSEITFLTKPEPPTSLTAQSNSTSLIYLNWNTGTGYNNTYIERNVSGVSIWDRGEGTILYNGSGANYEDSGLAEDITYYYQAWSYANWSYDSITFYQWSDANASVNNITHDRPKIDLANPSPNGTTDVSTLPICQIWANDSDSSTLDVYWFENSTGSYILRNTNSSISANSIVSYTFKEFSNYSATYYWKVAVNDSTYNTTKWFYFSTQLINTTVDMISPYIVTYSPYNLTVSGYSDLDKVTLWYQYSVDNISWSGWMENITDTVSPWKWDFTFSNGTGYYEFYSLGNKTGSPNETVPGNADAICNFNVSVNNPPTQSNEAPANQSTGIAHTPQLTVTVDDGDLDTLNATWWSNSSGSWVQFGSNLSIDTSGGSVNIIQTNSNFSDYGTIYWWSVNLTDEIVWTNETYYFTTALVNTSVDNITPYIIENITPLDLSATGPSDLDEVTLFYRWSDDNSSWGHSGETVYDTPVIDNVASETENTGSTSMSWSHTVSSSLSNSILIVGVNLEDDDAGDNYFVASADFNGDALVLSERVAADEGFTAISEIWYLLGPDAGSYTITVNFSVAINNAFGGSVSFSNVNQSIPDDTSTSTDIGDPSGLSTSAATVAPNSLIIAVATDGNSGFTYSYGSEETEIYNIDGTTHHGVGTYRIPSSAGSYTMFANLSGGTNRMSQAVAAWGPSSTVWGNGSDWMVWSNSSNPDIGSPWGWDFDFPNGTGYYEFYSVGNRSGSPDEVAPGSADAICFLIENLTIEITPSQWNPGIITIGSFVNSTGNYFTLSNNGTVSLDIQIKASNATNATTGAQWNLTSIPGFNNYSLQYNKSADISWTNINLTYDTFFTNLGIISSQTFDLKLIMATTSTKGDPLTITVTFRSVAS